MNGDIFMSDEIKKDLLNSTKDVPDKTAELPEIEAAHEKHQEYEPVAQSNSEPQETAFAPMSESTHEQGEPTQSPKVAHTAHQVTYASDSTPENGPGAMAIASLVLGIFSILSSSGSFVLLPGIFGLVCSIVGLVLSNKAKKTNPSGVATGGYVTSLLGLIFSAIGIAIAIIFFGIIANISSSFATEIFPIS